MRILRLAFAFALALAPTLADAQQFPTVPSQTVIGRTAYGPGPAQAIPFSSLISTLLSSAPNIPTINTNSIVFKGSTSGHATVQAQAVAGTATLLLPTVSGTIPSTATPPIQIDATGNISCPTCSTSTSAASPVIASRALAQTLNLSSFAGIVTAGYGAAGDGGGATFKNVGSSNFLDSQVLTGTLTASGSGYTAGTYLGVSLTGGSGTGLTATVVVNGSGQVSSVTRTGTGGNGYSANDTLSGPTSVIGSGSGFVYTINTVSTPTGSFTDSVGTHFQIVVDQGNTINIRQFGAAMNYQAVLGDASATNDFAAIQNCLSFAGYQFGGKTPDAGGALGSKCIVPAGAASKVCVGSGTLLVPASVDLEGLGWGSELKQCDSDSASAHFITLGDPAAHLACFAAQIKHIKLFPGTGAANSNVAMIYTNCSQQAIIIDDVAVYAGNRMCLFGDTGFGGAANFISQGLFCTVFFSSSQAAAIAINYGAAAITLKDTIVEAGGSTPFSGDGLIITSGGAFEITGWHSENVVRPIYYDVTSGGGTTVRIHSATGGSNCTSGAVVTRQSGSVANMIVAGGINNNGCSDAINNAGTFTASAVADVNF